MIVDKLVVEPVVVVAAVGYIRMRNVIKAFINAHITQTHYKLGRQTFMRHGHQVSRFNSPFCKWETSERLTKSLKSYPGMGEYASGEPVDRRSWKKAENKSPPTPELLMLVSRMDAEESQLSMAK